MALRSQLSAWVSRRERRRHTYLRVFAASMAVAGLAALCVDGLLYLPLVVAVPAAVYACVEWCWWHTWADRTDGSGNPRIRAALPRALVERPFAPSPAMRQSIQDVDVLVPGIITVTGEEWNWRASRLVNRGLTTVSWRSTDVLTPTLTRSWGPGLPPAGYLAFVSPGGTPVTAVVAEPDRAQALLDRKWRDRAWWETGK